MENSIIFDLGIVLIVGFIAASIMKRIGLSVIIGYIIAGILIGPFSFKIIKDTKVLESLSELGIVFLMFFLGLEFSINKFKNIKNSVFFIGTYEIIFNLLFGFLISIPIISGFINNLFLSCIIALSSSGVVAKLLFETKKTATKEAEILMGVMVFEDFFAIILLGILSSLAMTKEIKLENILQSITIAFIFYTIIILIGIFLVNKFIDYIVRIESQELFTALVLGLILLIGSLAHSFGLASAAGAFLLGMIIVSHDVELRVHRTVSAFKDIFLIVFFISFGTLLNPKEIPLILSDILIIVPLSILCELVVTSSAAYFCGFNSKKSVALGSSMIARGEYSMIFASIGLASGIMSKSLYQIAGIYVFIMTLLAPIIMKHSEFVLKIVSKCFPNFLKRRIKIIATELNPILMPQNDTKKHEYSFLIIFYLYFIFLFYLFTTKIIYIQVILTIILITFTFLLYKIFLRNLKSHFSHKKMFLSLNILATLMIYLIFLPFVYKNIILISFLSITLLIILLVNAIIAKS